MAERMASWMKKPTICIFSMMEYPFTKRWRMAGVSELLFEPNVRTVVIECRRIPLTMIIHNV
jgi:hypothetical protein